MRIGAMSGDGISIRSARSRDDMQRLLQVADEVWGAPAGAMVSPDFLMALAHTGGYVALAEVPDEVTGSATPVGASFGFLARCGGEVGLHSHITGVLPAVQHRAIGRRLKQHQRAWALANGLTVITWTFDPLVRRNGWFNLHVLGATAEEFHIDFYGPLGDAINGHGETDRLLARWDLHSQRTARAESCPLPPMQPEAGVLLVPTPADIVTLRRTRPEEAQDWHHRLREQLAAELVSRRIIGMTADGSYVLVDRSSDKDVSSRP